MLDRHKSYFPAGGKPSLLHMDIWSQNILITEDGNLSGVVDWDRGMWGDPEIEFSVLAYCGTSPAAFWKGYGKTPEGTRDFRIRMLFYTLYEHQKYIFIRSQRNGMPDLARRYAKESKELARKLDNGNV